MGLLDNVCGVVSSVCCVALSVMVYVFFLLLLDPLFEKVNCFNLNGKKYIICAYSTEVQGQLRLCLQLYCRQGQLRRESGGDS